MSNANKSKPIANKLKGKEVIVQPDIIEPVKAKESKLLNFNILIKKILKESF